MSSKPTKKELDTLRRVKELAEGGTPVINWDVVDKLDEKGWVEIQPKVSVLPIVLTEIGGRLLLRGEHSARG